MAVHEGVESETADAIGEDHWEVVSRSLANTVNTYKTSTLLTQTLVGLMNLQMYIKVEHLD